MKKIILISIILCLALTLFSCNKEPEKIGEISITEQSEDISYIPYEIHLGSYIQRCTDLFTATVIESKALPEDTEFAGFKINISTPVLYTVEVKSVLAGFSVTENTKIRVVRVVREADEQSEMFFSPFEVGKTYLIYGVIQRLKDKPVILDDGSFSVEIKDDGSLVPLSIRSGELFADTKTYEDFLQNEGVKEALKYTNNITKTRLPDTYRHLLKNDPMALDYKLPESLKEDGILYDVYGVLIEEKEEVQKLIKEALPIESKTTIPIPEKEK